MYGVGKRIKSRGTSKNIKKKLQHIRNITEPANNKILIKGVGTRVMSKRFADMSPAELIEFCDTSRGDLGALVLALVNHLRKPPEAMTTQGLITALGTLLEESNAEQHAAIKIQLGKKEADIKLSSDARKTLNQLVNNHPLLIIGNRNDI
jgi:hypothetical protein|tara:strand:+ start:4859 stop:5308 length:450 start_codon:yes stop_codon:yes gene_type:complete